MERAGNVSAPARQGCTVCEGRGVTTWCPSCGGHGYVGVLECFQRDCTDCGATGRVAEHACAACAADGRDGTAR